MVGFQMFPRSHSNYVFVTKIPRMLILYFTFLKKQGKLSFKRHCCHRIGTIPFLFSLNDFYCFWQTFLLTYQKQAGAHICIMAHICDPAYKNQEPIQNQNF